jgi:Domain of unknown function (DUF4349)
MRTKRAVPGRMRLAAGASLLIMCGALAAGCTNTSSGSAASGSEAGAPAAAGGSAAAGSVSSAAGKAAAPDGSGAGGAASTANLAASGHQIIYTAQLTVRAASVSSAISRAESIVAARGGYVSGEQAQAGQGGAAKASATVTFKIPSAAYAATLGALSGGGLGTQVSLSEQTQDVTQQVADTASRVSSDEAAIAQLRALLKRAGSVDALLSVQNEINQQESDLESMLAQQKALNQETSYATVTLTLTGPRAVAAKKPGSPPPGLNGGLAGGWHALRVTVSWLLTVFGAVAPFAAVIIVIGALAWWARRALRQRRPQRPAD